jgi:hypothetical protein
MFSLIAQTFLPSFHSVEGVDIFIAGASPKSKAKANYGTRCARGVSKATAKAKKRFFRGSGSNIMRSLAAARSVNDCIV